MKTMSFLQRICQVVPLALVLSGCYGPPQPGLGGPDAMISVGLDMGGNPTGGDLSGIRDMASPASPDMRMPLFGPANLFSVGTYPDSVVVGDFNKDGKLDVATANNGSKNISILLGNGGGTFAAATSYSLKDYPMTMAVGYIDKDDNLDLAVTIHNYVCILLGNGHGGFGSPSYFPVGTSGWAGVAIYDLNGDGRSDLAVAGFTLADPRDNVAILLGDGTGGFGAAVTYPTGSSPEGVAVADFNGDSIPDLAVANQQGASISILRGKGDGTFWGVGTISPGFDAHGSEIGATWLSVVDMDHDGHFDLADADGWGHVAVLLNTGDGNFKLAGNAYVGEGSQSVATADFDGDGNPDLVVADNEGNNGTISVLLGDGKGNLGPVMHFDVKGNGPFSVAEGDFNGDGKPDVVSANNYSNNVSVFLNLSH